MRLRQGPDVLQMRLSANGCVVDEDVSEWLCCG